MEYLIFYNNNFEKVRKKINKFFNLPKNGYKNGYNDLKFKTIDYILPKKHPSEDKYFLINKNLPDFVKEGSDEIVDKKRMQEMGWFQDEVP